MRTAGSGCQVHQVNILRLSCTYSVYIYLHNGLLKVQVDHLNGSVLTSFTYSKHGYLEWLGQPCSGVPPALPA